jgi:hypothetical protein
MGLFRAMPGEASFILAALAYLTCSTPSLALGTDEQRAACMPDVFRLCSAQIPNVDAIVGLSQAGEAKSQCDLPDGVQCSGPTRFALACGAWVGLVRVRRQSGRGRADLA